MTAPISTTSQGLYPSNPAKPQDKQPGRVRLVFHRFVGQVHTAAEQAAPRVISATKTTAKISGIVATIAALFLALFALLCKLFI